MEMIPKVLQAVAGNGFTVYVYFHDGTVRELDASELVKRGGVFSPLQDLDFFRDRLNGDQRHSRMGYGWRSESMHLC